MTDTIAPPDMALPDDDLVPVERGRNLKRFLRNRPALIGATLMLVLLFCAIFAPLMYPYPEDVADAVHFDRVLQPPSWDYWMGTDETGRDVLTRVLAGAKLSLAMGGIVIAMAVVIGVPVGLVAGYYGGKIEAVLMRITDVFSSIPALVLALAISVVLGSSFANAILALGLVWWRVFARLAHGQTLSLKSENYVTAARQMGASDLRIMFREILPNMASPLLVAASLDAGAVILIGTSISFLGAGASPPTAEWGLMVAGGRHYLPGAWWPSLFPGLAIFVTVMSLNLIGDGLRDLFAGD